MREGGLTCSFTNASPRVCLAKTKSPPSRFLPHFPPPPSLSSPACLSLQPQARYSVGERAVRLHTAHPAGINPARKRLPTAVVRHPMLSPSPVPPANGCDASHFIKNGVPQSTDLGLLFFYIFFYFEGRLLSI